MPRLALAILVALAMPALESGAQSSLYPTDACVAAKLDAAAAYCAKAVLTAIHPSNPQIGTARQKLADAWASAEAASDAARVSCADTTATADEMIAAIDAAAADAVADVAAASGGPACTTHRQLILGQTCQVLLQQEANHLRMRGSDRDRAKLDAAHALIAPKIDQRLGNAPQCEDAPDGDALVAFADEIAGAARYAAYVSPRVSSDWTMITPAAQVPYDGKTLEPICSRGTPWVFFVKKGTVNNTMMYYQGGGACWDHTTCTLPTYKVTAGPGDNPAGATTGFFNLSNPDNPFKDWNWVFVPYCTGDLAWGDTVQDYKQGQLSVTIRHKGFVNAQVAEKWAREHFANPDQVFVTGSSAGAYSAIVNSLTLQEKVWPSSDFAVLGDAGNGVITDDFKLNDLPNWGIEQNLPDWIPGLNVPLAELDASKLWSIPAEFYPHNRYANYASAYDGGQGGQVGFYNVMLNIDNPLSWLNWWPPSCEWNAIMRSYVQASAAAAPNYRYYIGSGSRHTMWGSNKVYIDTTGNVPIIRDWLVAMLGDTSDWVNVESDDPGLLLTGDPRPNPAEPPYTEDDRVVCE
jgi:Pectinacetylesterase